MARLPADTRWRCLVPRGRVHRQNSRYCWVITLLSVLPKPYRYGQAGQTGAITLATPTRYWRSVRRRLKQNRCRRLWKVAFRVLRCLFACASPCAQRSSIVWQYICSHIYGRGSLPQPMVTRTASVTVYESGQRKGFGGGLPPRYVAAPGLREVDSRSAERDTDSRCIPASRGPGDLRQSERCLPVEHRKE